MLGLGISLWNVSTVIGTGGGAGSGVAFLTLSDDTIPEDTAVGALVGLLSVVGGDGVYAFTLTDDALGTFALDGVDDTRLELALPLDYEVDTSHDIEITADNGVDTPIVRAFTIFVTNVLEVTLAALTLDNSSVEEGTVAATLVGAIVGRSSGSTLSLTDTAGNRFALSGTNIITGSVATDFDVATSHNITLRETHADGGNSPRDSVIAITVTEISEGGGAAGEPMGLLLALTKAA